MTMHTGFSEAPEKVLYNQFGPFDGFVHGQWLIFLANFQDVKQTHNRMNVLLVSQRIFVAPLLPVQS